LARIPRTTRADGSYDEITEERHPDQWQRFGSYAVTLVVTSRLLFVSFRPLFLHVPWMLFFRDDFFYYLKIAQNLAHGAGSSFNGLVPTNGYHPFWFLLLTCLHLGFYGVCRATQRSIHLLSEPPHPGVEWP
jgi:hypothetical protein